MKFHLISSALSARVAAMATTMASGTHRAVNHARKAGTFIVPGFLIPLIALGVLSLFASDAGDDASDIRADGRSGTILTPRSDHAPSKQSTATSGNGIYYHGGPVITGGTKVYYIWYGSWSGNTAGTILSNLALSVGGTRYFNIETTYTQKVGTSLTPVENAVTYGGSYNVTHYPSNSTGYSKNLSDNDILDIVTSTLTSNNLPTDAKGVYFVLTSADVNETSGFCSQYCAWHWSTSANNTSTINGVDVRYAFVGNPDRCPSACEAQARTSPNNNPGADGMADSIAHELEEAANDPDLNAWYDGRGNESADKCAWTYGKTQQATNGSQYNIVLNGMQYLLQRNWVNASGGYCAMQY